MPPPKQSSPPARAASPRTHPPQPPHEVVDPIWLLKALGLSFLAALLCAWFTVCLLFYVGEWQLILHPSHTVDQTPAAAHLAYETIRFDAGDTGQPRLTAWHIPAAPGAKYAAYTILSLHDGSGSLANTLPELTRLHAAGLNVFAIDYRGFGLSNASSHPTEARMTEDTSAALDYLLRTRHLPARTIIPYGTGLGAALAARLAQQHPELPAVILDNPDPDPTATAIASHPSRLVPVRLLFHERFDIAAPLAMIATPKLLILGGPNSLTPPSLALQALAHHAASPTFTVLLPQLGSEDAYHSALARFLNQYLPTSAN